MSSYNFSSGELVLAAARHYGWSGINVTITYKLPPDAPIGAKLLSYPDMVLPYDELADMAIDIQPITDDQPPAATQQREAPTPDTTASPPAARPPWLVPVVASLSAVGGALLLALAATLVYRRRRRQRLRYYGGGSSQDSSTAAAHVKVWAMSSVAFEPQPAAHDAEGRRAAGGAGGGGPNILTIKSDANSNITSTATGTTSFPAAAAATTSASLGGTTSAAASGSAGSAVGEGAGAVAAASASAAASSSTAACTAAPPSSSEQSPAAAGASREGPATGAAAAAAAAGGGGAISNVSAAAVRHVQQEQKEQKQHPAGGRTTVAAAGPPGDTGGDISLAEANRAALAEMLARSTALPPSAARVTDTAESRHQPQQQTGGRGASGSSPWQTAVGCNAVAVPTTSPPHLDDERLLKALSAYLRGSAWDTKLDLSASADDEKDDDLPPDAPPRAWIILHRGRVAMAAAIQAVQAELRDPDLTFEGVMASGAFGVVYRGQWRGLSVAVKALVVVLQPEEGQEGRARQRAVLEAAISMSMVHPNVVSTYAYSIKELVQAPAADADMQQEGLPLAAAAEAPQGKPVVPAPAARPPQDAGGGHQQEGSSSCSDALKLYIIQEYCNGGTLRDALNNGVAGRARSCGFAGILARRLALDIALGMRHIHSCRIVHGDLKPENVLLVWSSRTEPGVESSEAAESSPWASLNLTAKVADFGLSMPLSEGATHASQRFHGTPAYRAPEVGLLGQLSPRADVWSFGLMLIELFFGCSMEVVLATGAAILEAEAREEWLRRPGYACLQDVFLAAITDRPYADLVSACLSLQPRDRPDFQQLVTRLQQTL